MFAADTAGRDRVMHDAALGRQLQLSATPTYFINGTRVVGARTVQELRRMVERDLVRGGTR